MELQAAPTRLSGGVLVHRLCLLSNLGLLASLDALRAGLAELITLSHQWSTTCYGPRSEPGRTDYEDLELAQGKLANRSDPVPL